MNPIKTLARWTSLGLAAAAIVTSPAVASERTAASYYPPKALEAMSDSWSAKGRLLGSPDAASFYTREQLQAMSANWAAKARLVESTPQVVSDTFDWGDFGIWAGAGIGFLLLVSSLAAGAHYGRRGGVRVDPVA